MDKTLKKRIIIIFFIDNSISKAYNDYIDKHFFKKIKEKLLKKFQFCLYFYFCVM